MCAEARYEVNATDVALLDSLGIEDTYTPLVIRLGANYKITENTFMRFSYGQGYRSPSIVERFIEDKIPYEGLDLKLFPNPELVPEKGWNAEIGMKQGYNLANKVSGYLDLALLAYDFETFLFLLRCCYLSVIVSFFCKTIFILSK